MTTSEKKSRKRDFGPFSLDPYPNTIKRDILIRDIFDSIFPPILLIEIGTFLRKENIVPSSSLMTVSYISSDFDSLTGAINIKFALFDAECHKYDVCYEIMNISMIIQRE